MLDLSGWINIINILRILTIEIIINYILYPKCIRFITKIFVTFLKLETYPQVFKIQKLIYQYLLHICT